MSAPNYIGTTVPPAQKKRIAEYATRHFTEKLPRFLRLWFNIISKACESDIPPELIILYINETIEFWQKKKKGD